MSNAPNPTPPDDVMFVCACEKWMRDACRRESFYKEHDGKLYCVLHYPGTEKKAAFQEALQRKVNDEDFDYQGVWFPDEVYFENITFHKKADFRRAMFCANTYFCRSRFDADALFYGARFIKRADFRQAQFNEEVSFRGAQFSTSAYFSGAQISKRASFVGTVFNASVYFGRLNFAGKDSSDAQGANSNQRTINTVDAVEAQAKTIEVNFKGAIFKDVVRFKANKFTERALMRFANATFEKPERAIFQNIALCPHWFINVDPRKFTFINVTWGLLDKRDAIHKEIEATERSAAGDLSDLETTCRQLAVNAEENNRYEEAANFRYIAMEAKRLRERDGRRSRWEKLTRFLLRGLDWLRERRLWRIASRFNLGWWYWLMSGYGERVARAFVVLLSIWLLFAVIYWTGNQTWWQPKQAAVRAAQASAQQQQPSPVAVDAAQASPAIAPLTFPEAIIYSAGVLSLQKPEPLPANKRAKAFVLCETILGPLQAALLALAIRRKFMR
jgi:uncharacterized protein YjbI with pentapeptide repeats